MKNLAEIFQAVIGIIVLIMVTNAILPELSSTFQFSSSLISLVIFLAIIWLIKEVFPKW